MSVHELGFIPEFEIRPESLDRMQDHFSELYGRRNNVWLPGRQPRIDLLSVAVGDLQDAVRKSIGGVHQDVMFARVVSRVFCIAQGINDVSVVRAMTEKYPASGCSYCHSFPCHCEEQRPDADLGWEMTGEQLGWKLGDWQKHLGNLYGEKNAQNGINNVLLRLFKEVVELTNLERDEIPRAMVDGHLATRDVEHEFALELADCMAWTIAAANILGVDLEKVTMNRFWPTCWSCGQKPCGCSTFSFGQVREEVTSYRNQ